MILSTVMDMILFIGLSLVLSVISMPVIIGICKKFGLYDYHDERKIHSGDIPRLGGVGIVFSFVVSILIFLITRDSLNTIDNLLVLIAAGIIFVFAIVDDILNLPAAIIPSKEKFLFFCIIIFPSLGVICSNNGVH